MLGQSIFRPMPDRCRYNSPKMSEMSIRFFSACAFTATIMEDWLIQYLLTLSPDLGIDRYAAARGTRVYV